MKQKWCRNPGGKWYATCRGRTFPEQYRFCPYCGTKLKKEDTIEE